ncbi:MAG: hypothetical protein AB8B93_16580 [Pseudomonadales bacterium]
MLPTQPLSVGGILDAGINLYRTSFKTTFKVAAIAAVPYAVITALMSARSNTIDPEIDPELAMAAAMESLTLLPVTFLLLAFVMSALIHSQVAVAREQPTTSTASLLTGARLAIPYFVLTILYMVLIMLGMLALVIPGVIVSVSMALAMWVVHVEPERSVWGSLWRSHSLIWNGSWWRTAAVMAVVSIIGMVLSVVFYLGLGVLAFLEPTAEVSTPRVALEAAINWALMAIVAPLSSAVFLVLYNDALLRKEGADLDARLSQLESPNQP